MKRIKSSRRNTGNGTHLRLSWMSIVERFFWLYILDFILRSKLPNRAATQARGPTYSRESPP